jgi:flagellar biosynthesis protein FlhB
MFNSNLKLFGIDLAETRSLTIYSHNFGVIDEWRRYFGSDGIFNYYNFSLKITAVFILTAIVLSLSRLFQKSKHEILEIIKDGEKRWAKQKLHWIYRRRC